MTEHTSKLDEKMRMKGAEARKNEEKDNQGKEIRKAAMENIRPRNDDEQVINAIICTIPVYGITNVVTRIRLKLKG